MKEWELKSVKILKDLNYEKYDEIVEIPKIELKLERLVISKKSIHFNQFSLTVKIYHKMYHWIYH